MNRIILTIAALGLCLLSTTAATCQKPGPVVTGVIDCAEAGVHNAAVGLIDDVASALATGDYMSALADLVKRFGEGAIDCAVSEVAGTAGKHAALDPLEADKARRARAWLASRPVTLSSLPKKAGAHATAATGGALTVDVGSGAPLFEI